MLVLEISRNSKQGL